MNLLTLFVTSLTYLAITNNWTWQNLLVGFVIGLFITILFRPSNSWQIKWKTVPSMLFYGTYYVITLLFDLVISGFKVAALVLRNGPIRQGIVKHKPKLRSPLELTLHAYSITLTPGEMVVEIGQDGSIYTHTLDIVQTNKTLEQAQARRDRLLQKILQGGTYHD